MTCAVACVFVESVTINSVLYVPCAPIRVLLSSPVLAFSDIPSGSDGKFKLVLTENVYGGEPPVAVIVHPAYAVPCVPPGHEPVVIISWPPGATMLTCAVAVVDPVELVAVSV